MGMCVENWRVVRRTGWDIVFIRPSARLSCNVLSPIFDILPVLNHSRAATTFNMRLFSDVGDSFDVLSKRDLQSETRFMFM